MGYLLKEALKTLCGVNQWSYAVFWKIGCQNPKLLIWEEWYYAPVMYGGLPCNPGVENPDLGFEDWSSTEACNSQLEVQAGNVLHLLINKMMMDNHVNVLGDGIVGRAAFTGSHQWILYENYRSDCAHPPEVLREVCQQFSAGMKTIAVIPILPHGVVQLGSYMPIMENVAFVNDVKAFFLQLGCVPGVLLSENYAPKEPPPKIGVPVCRGNSVTGNFSERSVMYNSTPFIAESCEYKSNLGQAAAYVGQTSSVAQLPDLKHYTAAMFQHSNLGRSSVASHDDQCQAKLASSANTHRASTSQLAHGVVKVEVISSNPELWLNQQTSLCIPRSTFDQKPHISSEESSNCSLKLMEPQISSQNVFHSQTSKSFNVSSNLMMSILKTNAGLVASSSQDSVTHSSDNVSDLYGGLKSNMQLVSNFSSFSDVNLLSCKNNSGTHAGSDTQIANSTMSEVSLSKVVDYSSASNLLTNSSVSGYCSADNKFIGIDVVDTNDKLENDLYQALSLPLSQHDEAMGLSECIPGLTHRDEKHGYGVQSQSLGDAGYGDACAQRRSGDDLFDILGVDFSNKLLSSNWNNSQNSASESIITYLDKNNSTFVKGFDTSSDLYPINQGQSDSSIFCVTSTDHLLDAVISSIQPSVKQNLDDTVSCGTTLTNASSSSGPNASRSCSRVGLSGQVQGDVFGFPKSLTKPSSLGSYSFRSGAGKDNKSNYSDSGSMYGSQISSWTEHQDVKPSSSVSTAYSKKPDEMSKTNRKRLKPGENPRPRPKDRQMIQDRVKELREIVPNGAKCSIDALLERTIKHMLFLQSVTKHADKLKQTGDSKPIIGKEGGLLLKDNYDGGATWAYEVGSQSMACPVIVEDLNQPRQMLVEMPCEERGLFLEIADIIRGLGLTILKGVMETRNDKIWACFAVEANRDVTRMEIFISLVRLLEQTAKNGVPPATCIDNDRMMVHQFQQATSIPASGRPCDLQ